MDTQTQTGKSEVNLDVLLNVPVALSVEVGRAAMTIGELLDTGEGSIVKLSRLIDEPLDILVNDSPIAQGVVVTQDGKFGIQITDIISPHERARNLTQDAESPGAAEAEPDDTVTAQTGAGTDADADTDVDTAAAAASDAEAEAEAGAEAEAEAEADDTDADADTKAD